MEVSGRLFWCVSSNAGTGRGDDECRGISGFRTVTTQNLCDRMQLASPIKLEQSPACVGVGSWESLGVITYACTRWYFSTATAVTGTDPCVYACRMGGHHTRGRSSGNNPCWSGPSSGVGVNFTVDFLSQASYKAASSSVFDSGTFMTNMYTHGHDHPRALTSKEVVQEDCTLTLTWASTICTAGSSVSLHMRRWHAQYAHRCGDHASHCQQWGLAGSALLQAVRKLMVTR